jgi:hypothetical protein
MHSIKCGIKFNDVDKELVIEKRNSYSHAYRKLYSNYDKYNDKDFKTFIREKFNLGSYEYLLIGKEIDTRLKALKEKNSEKLNRIKNIKAEIKKLSKIKKPTKYESREKFNLNKKLVQIEKSLDRDITYGGRNIIQEKSRLHNKINRTTNEKELKQLNKRLEKKDKEYQDARMMAMYYGGEAEFKGNRHFNFDFTNKEVTYKINKDTHLVGKISTSAKNLKRLLLLEEKAKLKQMAITIYLKESEIVFTYDEEELYGYGLDKKACEAEKKLLPKEAKEEKKAIDKKYKIEQADKKRANKILNRCCGIDFNPNYIGVSIIDMNENDEIKVVETFAYDLSKLNAKNISSEKRNHEISIIYKDLFKKVNHYKCEFFSIEDLKFVDKEGEVKATESNRLRKNVWNRTLQRELITRYCNTKGIILREVKPQYSSFIGNLTYRYFDPCNAAIEIARRGIVKYKKGSSLYPSCGIDTILDNMLALNPEMDLTLLDAQDIKGSHVNWVSFNKLLNKIPSLRKRWQYDTEKYHTHRLSTRKSLVSIKTHKSTTSI